MRSGRFWDKFSPAVPGRPASAPRAAGGRCAYGGTADCCSGGQLRASALQEIGGGATCSCGARGARYTCRTGRGTTGNVEEIIELTRRWTAAGGPIGCRCAASLRWPLCGSGALSPLHRRLAELRLARAGRLAGRQPLAHRRRLVEHSHLPAEPAPAGRDEPPEGENPAPERAAPPPPPPRVLRLHLRLHLRLRLHGRHRHRRRRERGLPIAWQR